MLVWDGDWGGGDLCAVVGGEGLPLSLVGEYLG